MMEDDDVPAIVIDSGSGNCVGGFAGDDAPRSVFSSVIGRQRFPHDEITIDSMVGDEAQKTREFLSLKYPIERGIVTNWDDAEKIWDHCFHDLHVDPTSQPVLMSESVLNPAGNRERLAECMFEKFNVPAFFSNNSATLTLMASGRGVGLIVDIGEGITQVIPVHLISSQHAICRQEFGGKDVTLHLQKLLHRRGYSFTTTAELESVREIKEQLCYASLDFDKEILENTKDVSFTLPDGTKLDIGTERFESVECLFQPSLSGHYNLRGIHELIKSCLENCDNDIRRDFYCSVILCGGTSMMCNLPERLGKLWQSVIPHKMIGKIMAPPERKYSVWIGGSIMASLSTFEQAWITKQEYEEFGPKIVHRRCM